MRFSIISIFRAILNSHILQIVTLVQKLRGPKSFFGEIEFLAPSCFAGSTLTPNAHFLEKYIDVFASYAPVSILCKSAH